MVHGNHLKPGLLRELCQALYRELVKVPRRLSVAPKTQLARQSQRKAGIQTISIGCLEQKKATGRQNIDDKR